MISSFASAARTRESRLVRSAWVCAAPWSRAQWTLWIGSRLPPSSAASAAWLATRPATSDSVAGRMVTVSTSGTVLVETVDKKELLADSTAGGMIVIRSRWIGEGQPVGVMLSTRRPA